MRRGWEVHQQVGCAGYRIDLAVVDPESRGRYLLGVECDGANYHRAKTARDRDKLRQAVLEDLGWDLHRVWSTDWWTNPERELERIEQALDRARRRPRSTEGTERSVEVKPEVHRPPLIAAATAVRTERASPRTARAPRRQQSYRPFVTGEPLGSREEFYDQRAEQIIRRKIAEVVRCEGPISLRLAARRVASLWGLERVRERAIDRILRLVPRGEVRVQTTGTGLFLWPAGTDPARYEGFRVPGPNGEGAREPDDLPLEEIANAALSLLESHISAPLDGLVRETARLFGFQRVGHAVDERMRKGVAKLVEDGRARLEKGVLSMVGNEGRSSSSCLGDAVIGLLSWR